MNRFHLIGIGGIGMSAIARLLLQKGEGVQGSDIRLSPLTKKLEQEGAFIFEGQDEAHIQPGLTVVYSSDISENNPELLQARKLQLPTLHRSRMLEKLLQGKKGLFVCGTHGKTTTSALLAHLLLQGGKDPTFVLGGLLLSSHTNAKMGGGEYFVVEGDESDGSFLVGRPHGAIVTNVEIEHLSYWKNFKKLKEGFQAFVAGVEEKEDLFWCAEDPVLNELSLLGNSYGFCKQADCRCLGYRQEGFSLIFDAYYRGVTYKELQVPLIGRHNVLNALSVFAMGVHLGLAEEAIRCSFASFLGTARRMEKVKEKDGRIFFDDYAHHPTEIRTTLEAFRQAVFPRRVVCIFQPHRYSRVKDLGHLYPDAFYSADVVVMTDIYAAGETPVKNDFFEQMKKKKGVHYFPYSELKTEVPPLLQKEDAVITLGAGTITDLFRGEDV